MSKFKNIGIIVAMKKELNLLLPLIQNVEEIQIDGYILYKGTMNDKNITVMQCGIGKVNAAIGTITLLNNMDADLIINTGVAGGADRGVNVMDVIVGADVAHHDVWCGPGTEYGIASGYDLYFHSHTQIVELIEKNGYGNVKKGLICSGDKFIATIEEVNDIKAKFPAALAVDMESASIAQVCALRNIPFFCLRVISDSPGANHDNMAQYDNFWEDAPIHTFKIIKELLIEL